MWDLCRDKICNYLIYFALSCYLTGGWRSKSALPFKCVTSFCRLMQKLQNGHESQREHSDVLSWLISIFRTTDLRYFIHNAENTQEKLEPSLLIDSNMNQILTNDAHTTAALFAFMHLLIIVQWKLMLHFPPAVYRYFSARARARADRNLSMDTWTWGVKSSGNMLAMTTMMQWDRICENRTGWWH